MQIVERVDPDEVTALLREARRLATSGGTEAERHAFSMWKQELLDRMSGERCRDQSGELR